VKLAQCFLRTNPIEYLKVEFKHDIIKMGKDVLEGEVL
jgi:hypothetical protein